MELKNTTLETDSAFSLEQLNGTTTDLMPFVAFLVKAAKADARLRLAGSETGQTVSQFAASAKALVAINGGFNLLNGVSPLDWLVVGWKTIRKLESMNRPCINLAAGRVTIVQPAELDKPSDVLQAGPILVINGQKNDDFSEYRKNAAQFEQDITSHRFPRTVFGINDSHFFFLVVDGGSKESVGLFLREAAQLSAELGMKDAINLAGGGSSAMTVNGKLVNKPRAAAHQVEPAERVVPSALLLFSKVEPAVQPRPQQRPGARTQFKQRFDF